MVVDITTGMAFLTSMGLPEILLWILSFAVIFGILVELKILKKAPAALISLVLAFFVLMAAPVAVISVLATMSTGLVLLAIGALVLISLLAATGSHEHYGKHTVWVALAVIVIVTLLFVGAGGLAVIGLSTGPVVAFVSSVPWFLVIIGGAVIWMLYEAGKSEEADRKAMAAAAAAAAQKK